ncbi:hypothetical protein [Sphingomonas sp.]|uniref:hypothetical protein n=1 Tax=Sphingomonas sp. TaxID=28214 RepID=UPI00262FD066|nr:hypothetical protein [Sphingomonas sp.]MDF2493616.1 hypothetical protein [Sphingomonas sp.]
MSRERKRLGSSIREQFWSSLFFMCFGVAILLFLVAIEHQEWFSLTPATGTAEAMSYASTSNDTKS